MYEMSEPSITVNQKFDEDIRVICRSCKQLTRHDIKIAVESYAGIYIEDGHYEDWVNDAFQVIICKGCKTLSFRRYTVEDGYRNPDTGKWIGSEDIYPEVLAGRTPNKDSGLLPPGVRRIYHETVKALNSNQPILTGIGLRALVEAVCQEEGIKKGRLANKIDELVNKNKLTPEGATFLHHIRLLGNDAAHEAKPHSIRKLSRALDIIEYLLQGVYIFPSSTKYGILE